MIATKAGGAGMLRAAERRGRKFLNPEPTGVGGVTMFWKVAPEFFFGGKKRRPRRALGPFRTDAGIYAAAPGTGLRITWMGHSSLIVEIDGVRILIDPVWEERAAPVEWSGPKRFFAAPLRLEEMPRIDGVIVSHDHYDHLGAQTVRALAGMAALEGAQWITTLGVGAILRGLGVPAGRCVEMDWMDEARIGGVRVTALPARHFSGRSLFNRFETLWASFAIAGPEHRIYYGADSGEWGGYGEIGERFGPFDVAMFEIGAFDPLWADIHMGPEGAVRSFRALGGGGMLMPIHWGLFDLALHHWTEPIERVWSEEGLKIWSPEPGAPEEVERGRELRAEWWR